MSTNTMWGGRFQSGPAAIMREITPSIDFDKRLAAEDLAGSRAHCRMLASEGIISKDDGKAILDGLTVIEKEIADGGFVFKRELEDIHLNIEARLAEIIGPVAGRLHTARSRNDQVVTDFRLWVRAARDRGRFEDARKRLNESPLGAAALAGTSFPIDRDATAMALGFARPMRNSMDAISARDFALEYLAAAVILATNLSRLAAELVQWSTPQFGFVRLSDAFTTGSSIMPQKRNPDAAELIRGKTGRVLGDFVALATVVKGLVLTYGTDLQEDKEGVFDAADTIEISLAAMAAMIADLTANPEKMRAAAEPGYPTATDLADWLVRVLKKPFREAHHIAGSIVKLAEGKGVTLEQLPLAEMQAIEPGITKDALEALSLEASVNARMSLGGTAPARVKEQIQFWRSHLK